MNVLDGTDRCKEGYISLLRKYKRTNIKKCDIRKTKLIFGR